MLCFAVLLVLKCFGFAFKMYIFSLQAALPKQYFNIFKTKIMLELQAYYMIWNSPISRQFSFVHNM